jgi:hypothetical protein
MESAPRTIKVLDLPNELLLEISYSLETTDVHSLVLTNRRLNHLLQDRLHQHPPTLLLKRVIDTDNIKAFQQIINKGLDVNAHDDLTVAVKSHSPNRIARFFGYPLPAYVAFQAAGNWVRRRMLMLMFEAGAVDGEEWCFMTFEGRIDRRVVAVLLETYGVQENRMLVSVAEPSGEHHLKSQIKNQSIHLSAEI